MNKRFIWIPVILVLVLGIGFTIFNSSKPPAETIEAYADKSGTAVNETAENSPLVQDNLLPIVAESSPTDKINTDQGQAAPTKTVAAAQPAVTKPVVKETVKTSIPVSRSTSSTDIYKYPTLSKVNGIFGQFRYRDLSGGRIEVDPKWIAENIVTITLPGLNRSVQVNKRAADNFIQAFTYIKNGTATINGKQVPLLSLIHTMDGTFVTRHVNWNSSRGLSNHSWGTAIDINANNHFRYVNPTNEPNDPNLILWEKAFKPAGFSWGNSYSDSMHYELLK